MEVSTIMMIVFITFTSISMYKLYISVNVSGDMIDRQEQRKDFEERFIMALRSIEDEVSAKAIYEVMITDKSFDHELHPNFNQHQVNNLIREYYAIYPEVKSLEELKAVVI
jgi:hypothetical protein